MIEVSATEVWVNGFVCGVLSSALASFALIIVAAWKNSTASVDKRQRPD